MKSSLDHILQSITSAAQPFIGKYEMNDMPDPALSLSLPNEVRTGANFFAFQKTFEGRFTWDVFFDSKSASTPSLDRECSLRFLSV
jgi:mannosyl-oligosaccharide glucosidase